MSIEKAIQRGNIVTVDRMGAPGVGRYLGNGRFGAVISDTGLNRHPQRAGENENQGRSQYMHMGHWGRFSFYSEYTDKHTTADYIVPMFQVYWENEEVFSGTAAQRQDFYNGVLETELEFAADGKKGIAKILNWFDMDNKNMAGIRIELSEGQMPIIISALTEFNPYPILWKRPVCQKTSIGKLGENWHITLTCTETSNSLASTVYFRTDAETQACEDGLRILAKKGIVELFISYGEPVKEEDIGQSLHRSAQRWHELWENNGWFDFPDEKGQKMWVRSMAYLLSTFSDDFGSFQPASGLTGNMFPFNFVQDMEYVCPALLMTGHTHIVKRWVEKFAAMIVEMRQYAKRLWPEAKGIYPPWELPYGEVQGYHEPYVPIVYCYEPHNAGYLCRMAAEASEYEDDQEWTERFVYPLISELCLFYQSLCRKEEDGYFHFAIQPCVGQDEAGGRNKKDYLCILYSARYCFQKAVEYGIDPEGCYERLLADGLPFQELMSEEGIYHTCPGADDFGRQKHPVQLNGLAYFPLEREPMEWERKAYQWRYKLTSRAKEPCFFGWTLGEFLLAGSNLGDAQGWQQDWNAIGKADYTDEQWVQIYESSGASEKSFYTTTHGLILQSLMRNYVNDYWGQLQAGACRVYKEAVSFGNINTRLGVRVSGTIDTESAALELSAWKDCSFSVNGKQVNMMKDETLLCIVTAEEMTFLHPGEEEYE